MKHYPKIDGLRFIAIAFVLLEHFANGIGSIVSAGYFGVNLFFVVSGFLITSILLQSQSTFQSGYKNFVIRRALRIFPIYYLTVLILLIFQLDIIREYIFYFLTYSFNYVLYNYDVPQNPVNHFWSLCFEEQFYLVWPILVLLLKKNTRILIILSGVAVAFCFSLLTYSHLIGAINYRIIGLFSSIGFLMFGGLAALLFSSNKVPKFLLSSKIVEFFVWPLLLVSLVTNLPTKYVCVAFCCVFLVLKSADSNFHFSIVNKLLTNKKAIFIGTISYGIYVYHLPVSYYFEKYIFNPVWASIHFESLGILGKIKWYSWLVKLPLYSFFSIVLAFISFKFIEKPILRLKDTYFKREL